MRLLIYVFPALVDMILGSVMFLTTVRMAESGASATAVTLLMTVWSFVYMLCSFFLSRVITSSNAIWFIVFSGVILACVCLGFIVLPNINLMYLLIVIVAIGNAMFFAPFQVFMKSVENGESGKSEGIVRSTALYTFAWSTGIAMGPFITGYLWKQAGWNVCFFVNASFALLTSVGIFLLNRYARCSGSVGEGISRFDSSQVECCSDQADIADVGSTDEYRDAPDLAWLAWFGAGVGILVIMVVRGILPVTGVSLHIDRPELGIVFALISMTQGIMGLSFIKSRVWMFKIKPIIFFGLIGAGSLFGFAFAKSLLCLYVCAVCLGVYSGSIFFYFVFHSLVHPTKAPRYIAINEAVVGLVGIIGPLVGGVLVDGLGLSSAYIFGGLMILGAMIFKSVIHYRNAGWLAK